MAISKKQKEDILADLMDSFSKAKSVVFAENAGLSVQEIQDFRTKLREVDSETQYKIAKKTLIKLAATKTDYPQIPDSLISGPVGVVFSPNDELISAQMTYRFAKGNEKLVVKGGIFFGEIVDADKVVALAKIPPKDQLLAQLVGCMQAPISNFAGIGRSLIASFVRVCSEVAKQKS